MREYSGYKILVKPSFLKPFGFLYKNAQPLYPYVLISKERYQKALSGDPSSISLLEHEVVHLNRIKQIGIFKWYFLYIFSPKFRLQEEIIAYKQQFKILRKYRIVIDFDWYAKVLSNWTYGKMVSFEQAKRLLVQ